MGVLTGPARWWRSLVLVPLLLATVLASAASAQAVSFSLSIGIQGPSSVTVGASNVVGGLNIVNTSVGLGSVTLTSITYHPSCADFTTACTSPETGVFTLGSTAFGGAGTACAGRTFTVTSDVSGRYTFATSPAIVLAPPGAGDTCTISFTFSSLRVPTTDSTVSPGIQTTRSAILLGTATATGGGTVNGTSRSIASITVLPVQTTVVTQVSAASVAPGVPFTDTATVVGAAGVAVTGLVTFKLYGPDDGACATAAAFTSTVLVAGNGMATSAPFATSQPGVYRFIATYGGDVNNSPVAGVCNAANEVVTVLPPGRYVPLAPARILDTRDGTGGIVGPLGAGAAVNAQVAGRGGVPASGVSAVVMNVTVTQPTAAGFLTLYPAGAALPATSNLGFTPGQTVPNLVVVKLGTNGMVGIYNSAGATQVVLDVAGWYSDSAGPGDGRYRPVVPSRILDTRDGTGGGVRLGPGSSIDVQVAGFGGVPATGASAAVLNIAATQTTAPSFVTVFPTGSARPGVSNLNFTAGQTVSNRAMVKLGTGGKVTIYNLAGGTDIIVDVGGWYTDGSVPATGGTFAPVPPARILDTRDGTGGVAGIRPAATAVDVVVTGVGGVPATGVSAVVLNVTVTQPAGPGFVTVFPAGGSLPLASDVTFAAGETRPNLAVVAVGAGGKVTLYVSAQAHVIFDVAGVYF